MKDKLGTIVLVVILAILLFLCNRMLNTQEKNTENKTENTVDNSVLEEDVMSEKILVGTVDNFIEEVFQSDKTVLIDFYADWCGPCKKLSPIVSEIADERDDIKVVKVNVDQEQDVAIDFQVMSIPTLVVLKEGKVTNRAVGLIEKEEILELLK